MIVELLLGAGLVLAGAATARVLAGRRSESATHDEAPADEHTESESDGPRGLRVGDVLLYADTELWLAGMIELDEEGFVARLFPSPGGVGAEWVAQLDEDATDLAALRSTDDVPAGAVPESLPIGGRRLSLERRGDALVRTEGEHLPRTTAKARYSILSDAGGRLLVVLDFEKAPRVALLGDRVPRAMIDLLPGGDLEPDR